MHENKQRIENEAMGEMWADHANEIGGPICLALASRRRPQRPPPQQNATDGA
jgi:hypothetical protein